ncbi:MFS general substrate transporter [Mycena floridula]|nr:MFS general substrate transporter [Mycena floridula]
MESKSAPYSRPDVAKEPVFDGVRAWACCLGGALVTLSTSGYFNAFGVYQDVYTRSHDASASNISWIGSTQVFLLLAIGLPAGKLLDMGYFRQTSVIGTVIYIFSLFMVSISDPTKYYQIYLAQGLGMGIGAGLLYVPAIAVQGQHFRKHRALAMGFVVAGSSVGGVVFPIMLNQLFEDPSGFKWGVRASAFVVLVLLVLANLLMATNKAALVNREQPKPDLKATLTDVPYLIFSFGVVLVYLGVFFPYFYLQLFAVLHGVDSNVAFYSLSVLNASALFGRILPNILSNRIGPFNTMILFCTASVIMLLALLGVTTAAGTIVFAILYGFTSGAVVSLCGPAVASLTQDPREVGIRFGISFGLTGFGVLIGTPINGAILGSAFPWANSIVFSAVAMAVGALGLVLARYLLVKRKKTHLV